MGRDGAGGWALQPRPPADPRHASRAPRESPSDEGRRWRARRGPVRVPQHRPVRGRTAVVTTPCRGVRGPDKVYNRLTPISGISRAWSRAASSSVVKSAIPGHGERPFAGFTTLRGRTAASRTSIADGRVNVAVRGLRKWRRDGPRAALPSMCPSCTQGEPTDSVTAGPRIAAVRNTGCHRQPFFRTGR